MERAEIIAKWRKVVLQTRRLDEAHAVSALSNLYAYVGRATPAFVFYESPHAALDDFARWRDRTGRVATVYWEWMLPLCDPNGAFWGRRAAWAKRVLQRSVEEEGTVAGSVIHDAWRAIDVELGRTWCDSLHSELVERYEQVFFGDLQAALDREDPTSQILAHEWVSLGPFGWLANEVACVNVCKDILGARVDPMHASTLSNLLRHCSIVYAFQRLCVVCDRPARIDAETLVFGDGAQFSFFGPSL